MQIIQCTMYSVQCAVYSVQCKLDTAAQCRQGQQEHSVQPVYKLECTVPVKALYSVQCIVYSVQCSVQCTVSSVHKSSKGSVERPVQPGLVQAGSVARLGLLGAVAGAGATTAGTATVRYTVLLLYFCATAGSATGRSYKAGASKDGFQITTEVGARMRWGITVSDRHISANMLIQQKQK